MLMIHVYIHNEKLSKLLVSSSFVNSEFLFTRTDVRVVNFYLQAAIYEPVTVVTLEFELWKLLQFIDADLARDLF